jgi:hypothetical protein
MTSSLVIATRRGRLSPWGSNVLADHHGLRIDARDFCSSRNSTKNGMFFELITIP